MTVVRHFLELAGYYCRFVLNYSEGNSTLTDFTQKKSGERAFIQVKVHSVVDHCYVLQISLSVLFCRLMHQTEVWGLCGLRW